MGQNINVKERTIAFVDGSKGLSGDFPVAVVYEQVYDVPGSSNEKEVHLVVDPVFNDKVFNNLFGRIITLVEATTDAHKLKPVKDLFSKELSAWAQDVHRDARELAEGGNSSHNIYDGIFSRD